MVEGVVSISGNRGRGYVQNVDPDGATERTNPISPVNMITVSITGGSASVLFAKNPDRRALQVQVPSDSPVPAYVSFGTVATGSDWEILPGGTYETPPGAVPEEEVSVYAASNTSVVGIEFSTPADT